VGVPALDHDVAGQPAEAQIAKPRPQQPDDNEHETNGDKPPTHRQRLIATGSSIDTTSPAPADTDVLLG
jgi:hypothetical protein